VRPAELKVVALNEHLGGRVPLQRGCFVCRREPVASWQSAAYSLFEQIDMHCAHHAEEFHAVVGHRFICCTPAAQRRGKPAPC
jgi:hypothetical protein